MSSDDSTKLLVSVIGAIFLVQFFGGDVRQFRPSTSEMMNDDEALG